MPQAFIEMHDTLRTDGAVAVYAPGTPDSGEWLRQYDDSFGQVPFHYGPPEAPRPQVERADEERAAEYAAYKRQEAAERAAIIGALGLGVKLPTAHLSDADYERARQKAIDDTELRIGLERGTVFFDTLLEQQAPVAAAIGDLTVPAPDYAYAA